MKDFIGKNVVIELKTSNKYFGKVIETADVGDDLVFITIMKKDGKHECFPVDEILRIEEI